MRRPHFSPEVVTVLLMINGRRPDLADHVISRSGAISCNFENHHHVG
jgi:hypothetical protein